MCSIKKNLKNLKGKFLYGCRFDSETYVRHLRLLGMKIGERVVVFDPQNTCIDETRPWMISIGDDVQITRGVTILTHGYDWSVLKGLYGEVLGSAGEVVIGNNVFIGMQSTILKGVHIGNNVIIGANSLVNKDIPDNVVAAGNPCKVIMNIDEYHEKRKRAQVEEAENLVRLYIERYGTEPGVQELREFFWLFQDNPEGLPDIWKQVNKLVGNETYTNEVMRCHPTKFDSMKQFLWATKKRNSNNDGSMD